MARTRPALRSRLFDEMAAQQGTDAGLPHATDTVIARLERELAGSIGAASAHAMVTRIAGQESVGITELIDIADETQELIETSRAFEANTRMIQNQDQTVGQLIGRMLKQS